ncbi:hypothetical protein LBMAG53_09260 [Planctomycetota bacterium]|nr:hypothetical protein LBMAG53_09260 [Planctomycetota bacterium]
MTLFPLRSIACLVVACTRLLLAAEPSVPAITGQSADYFGPNGAYADAGGVKLVDQVKQITVAWVSEEGGIGFGKAFSGAMGAGYLKGSGLPPSGAAQPIIAGGLVIQSYFLPRGPLTITAAEQRLSEKHGDEFKSFSFIAADDVVIAIDAATGKTRWKQVFEDRGINFQPGKRGEWNITPCAADGKVVASGTTGRLYCLELASGKVLWESNVGEAHTRLEAAKKEALATRTAIKKTRDGYGQLITLDGVVVSPDWNEGLIALDLATGAVRWTLNDKHGLTSGYNAPVPVTIDGTSYLCTINATGDLRLIDHRTGKVLWTHALNTQHLNAPVFGKELLLVQDPVEGGDGKKKYGVMAGYRLSLQGATRVWQLDPKRYPVPCWMDAGPTRKVSTRRDGVLYYAAAVGFEGKLATVRESDGQILASIDDCDHYWASYLWGDKFYFLTDIQHGKHDKWQVYGNDPANLTKLDEALFPSYGTHRVVGYEVPLHEVYADGFMYVREAKDRWGGIVCYDLRKPSLP